MESLAKFKGWIVLGGILLIALMVYGGLVGTYNGMVSSRETVDTQWSQVETQYQRRYDLIPNLVNATKGVLVQEQTVFGQIADARTHYAGAPAGSSDKVAATNQLEGALSRLLVIMENYPVLQSNQTVKDLMVELAGTENRVNVARERYNESARDYNISVKSFPRSVLAGMFHFDPKPLFEAQTGASTAPVVNLDTKK